jgi:hypothetical protein
MALSALQSSSIGPARLPAYWLGLLAFVVVLLSDWLLVSLHLHGACRQQKGSRED